ncbi:hypothetical protein GCM10020295_08470 [Streptomyces cinereospinus]
MQVVDGLRRALPGAEHDGAAHRRGGAHEIVDARQQLAGVPDPFGAFGAGWQVRLQPGGDAEGAGPVDGRVLRGGRIPGGDVEVADLAAVGDGPYGEDLRGVPHERRDPAGRPREVVVELDAQREQRLLVEEVDQSAPFAQVAQEAEVTGGVAHGHQVLEERHLHRGVVDEHAAMPAEPGLPFEEQGPQPAVSVGRRAVLLKCDRQGEIGRPEADAQKVVDGIRPALQCRHRFIASREGGPTVFPKLEHGLPQAGTC